jgi:serine/threonine-protein kinase RsbW
MSEPAERESAQQTPAAASLRLANGPLSAPVLCRVVSMVMARADAPMDRLEDAMLVCDAISAHAHAHSADGHLSFTLNTDRHRMEMRVAELSVDGARGLLRDAGIPGVGNVLERLTDELRVEPSAASGHEELVLAIRF